MNWAPNTKYTLKLIENQWIMAKTKNRRNGMHIRPSVRPRFGQYLSFKCAIQCLWTKWGQCESKPEFHHIAPNFHVSVISIHNLNQYPASQFVSHSNRLFSSHAGKISSSVCEIDRNSVAVHVCVCVCAHWSLFIFSVSLLIIHNWAVNFKSPLEVRKRSVWRPLLKWICIYVSESPHKVHTVTSNFSWFWALFRLYRLTSWLYHMAN